MMSTESVFKYVAYWIFTGAVVLLGACFLGMYYVVYQVPLAAEDMFHLSWLGYSYSSAVYPSGILGTTLIGIFALITFLVGIYKEQMIIGLVGVLVGGCFWSMPSPFLAMSAISGIYHNQVKLGCFVENSVECKKMLGLPSKPEDISLTVNGVFTPEAEAAYRKIESERSAPGDKAAKLYFGTIPGSAMFDSLFIIKDLDRVKAKVETQRTRVTELKSK